MKALAFTFLMMMMTAPVMAQCPEGTTKSAWGSCQSLVLPPLPVEGADTAQEKADHPGVKQ